MGSARLYAEGTSNRSDDGCKKLEYLNDSIPFDFHCFTRINGLIIIHTDLTDHTDFFNFVTQITQMTQIFCCLAETLFFAGEELSVGSVRSV
jgi:hypothetical protein